MRKLSVSQLTFGPGHTFEEDVQVIARLGIEGISLLGGKVDQMGLKKAKRLIRDAGLKVAGHAGIGWFSLPGDMSKRIDEGKRRIEEAAELEADFLLVKTGPRGELTWDDARRRFLAGIQEVAPLALDNRVDLALEPSHPILAFNSFVNTLRDALEIAAEVEGMGVVLDTWHSWWDPRLLEDIRSNIDSIYNVQLSDYAREEQPVMLTTGGPRVALGRGMIPFKEILYPIDEAGFDRYYDIEVIGSFSPEQQRSLVSDCKAYFDAIWN